MFATLKSLNLSQRREWKNQANILQILDTTSVRDVEQNENQIFDNCWVF